MKIRLILISILCIVFQSIAQEELLIEKSAADIPANTQKALSSLSKLNSIKRFKTVYINPQALENNDISITLFDSKKMRLKKKSDKDLTGYVAKQGCGIRFEDIQMNENALFTLSQDKKTLNGTIFKGMGKNYEVYSIMPVNDDGLHVLIEKDPTKFPVY